MPSLAPAPLSDPFPLTPTNLPVPPVMIVLSRNTNGGPKPNPEQESSAQQIVPCPLNSKTLLSSYLLIKLSKNGTHTPVGLPLSSWAPLGEKESKMVGYPLIVHLLTFT